MIVIRQKNITNEDLKANPRVLYIFGDNLYRRGLGGQAKAMRGEMNSFGIATKRRPSHGNESDYFHDSDKDVITIIENEFYRLYQWIINTKPKAIVIPTDGIGTGLAMLPEKAPNLLKLINEKLKELERI